MGHDHAHHGHGGSSNLRTAFLLNLGFTVIEIVGGMWTNSIAILADAVHDLGDCLSLGVAWYLHRLSKRGRTVEYTYGYQRFSVIGALVTGVTLLVGLGFVLWHAVHRLKNPEPVMAPGMMVLAVIGIAMNGAAVLRTRHGTSISERVVSWHLMEDVLGWIAVLIGAVVMQFFGWPIVDPLLSILISLFVLYNLGRNLRKALDVLLQRSPASFEVGSFEAGLREMPKVVDVHDTHVWTLDGESHVLTTHLVMEAGTTREEIVAAKCAVRSRLDVHEFGHVTVDVELGGETCVSGRGAWGEVRTEGV